MPKNKTKDGKKDKGSSPNGVKKDNDEQKSRGSASKDIKEKKSKGHQQKGSGTVVRDSGEKKVGGVVLHSWQRTPKQLLHEYSQREGRKKPFYRRARAIEGKYRACAILPDPKGKSERDLVFCTNEGFDTMSLAENFSAIIALKHLAPSRPVSFPKLSLRKW